LARRIPRLSTTFRRTLAAIGVRPKTAPYRAVFAAIGALEDAETLPGPGDHETRFVPGRAYVRRVSGHNVWILYRFDANHIFVITARAQPPVPLDD
jgi:hypothetical protein